MVNGTLLNFGKRYEDNLRVIFDQWPKLHLGFDALSNQKILKGVQLHTAKTKQIIQRLSKVKYDGIENGAQLHSACC